MSNKPLPKPFRYRDGYRAQITRAGHRQTRDFAKYAEATQWIAQQSAQHVADQAPYLGGPGKTTLAQALQAYAHAYTLAKGGRVSELNRINHYLEAAGLPRLKIVTDDNGRRKLVDAPPSSLPSAFSAHVERRRDARQKTYAGIAALASKRCSAIATVELRQLMTDMASEGLSPSTVQKEIALLKHLFNVAANEWKWTGFLNPCAGIKLGKSASRFVFLSGDERARLSQALAQCDNPYVWPLIEIMIETSMRRGSVLEMRWESVDLDGRIAFVPTKTGHVSIPLSERAVLILRQLPRERTSPVFPMTGNALDMAWEGVREKAGLPTLQLRDLRHLAPTELARQGLNAHQLCRLLGHKSTRMAEVYVNLVNQDVLDAMDRAQRNSPVIEVPPPVTGTAGEAMKRKRSARMAQAVMKKIKES